MFVEEVARLKRQAEENYKKKQVEFDEVARKARRYEFEKLMKEVGNYCAERGIEGYERLKKLQWVFDNDKKRQKEHAEDMRKNREVRYRYVPPPDLPARILSQTELSMLEPRCYMYVALAPNVGDAVEVIKAFTAFCKVLARPENHIKVRSGQYVEKEVPVRHEIDMVNEAARELVGLSKYVAFAKVTQERGAEQRVCKGRIRTIKN